MLRSAAQHRNSQRFLARPSARGFYIATVLLLVLGATMPEQAYAQTRYAVGFDALTDEWDYVKPADRIYLGETYTIETWIKTSRTDGGGRVFANNTFITGSRKISLHVGSSGNIGFAHDGRDSGSGTSINYYPDTEIRDGEWHHIAAVKTADEMLLYVDGVLIASEANTDLMNQTGYPVIGRNAPNDSGSPFVGQIDDFRIWSTARTATEIRNKRTFKLTGDESGLELYYPLDEGSGSKANDATSNNNDGTYFGDKDWVVSTVITDSNPDIEAEAGNALRFGANNEYVQANAVSASLTADFTLEAWIEPEADQPNSGGAIFALNTSSAGNTMLLMYDDEDDLFRYFDAGTSTTTEGDIGLQNMQKRLALLSPGAHQFNTTIHDGLFRAQLTIAAH